ncbi:17033_t:CDS:10 [Funneliformis geosporum]|uniref:14434_t:CDS:1 n=1 Tax=Funneliformis geosporum TaxID=1117311 RepID=A0A9W4SJR6_9GLOM|nr:14434_t:CDS:10 [Funneliformis geosporum]CAI2177859.1 17033_t:CDS:10 [Funneliformis geosporum]
MNIQRKVAIVTGASSGIGRAIAIRLVNEGAKVVIADINEDAGNLFANELNTNKSEIIAIFHKTDVSKWKELISLFDKTKVTFGKIDIVINNAGIVGQPNGMLEDSLEEPDFARTLNIDLLGVAYGGVIINTASVAALYPIFNVAVYAAAKAGVVSLTRSMAQVSQLFGITVNAVCPSVTESGLTTKAIGFLPEHWWSPVNFVVDACFKCIYNPKTNGSIFSVWYEGIKEEKFEKYHTVFEEMLQGDYQNFLKTNNINTC